MEYMDLGSLDFVQKRLGGTISERVLSRVAESVLLPQIAHPQMLLGLLFLHTNLHMLHRDIKPANVLLNTKGEVKLTDFGVSGYVDETGRIRTSWEGTTSFMSISFACDSEESFTDTQSVSLARCTTNRAMCGHLDSHCITVPRDPFPSPTTSVGVGGGGDT